MEFQKTNRLAYINFLRSKYEAYTGEVLVRSYPYVMGVDPTSICQLRCPSCPTGVENESRRIGEKISIRERTMMDDSLLEHVLEEVGENLFFVMFYNWGEPLLNRHLPAFIRRAKSYQIFTEVHTNLSLRIEDEFLEELLTSGIDIIAASIDGFSQESYGTYRRGGNYELAKSNIARLAALRDHMGLNTEIIWNFLVFSFNEHEIDAARSYCETIGISFNQREAFIDNPDWLPSYRKAEAQALAGHDVPKVYDIGSVGVTVINNPQPCAWHYHYSIVNSNGSVSPCCAPWEQILDFGLLEPGRVSFVDVWNNNRFRKSRAAFAGKKIKGLEKLDTLCLRCPYGPNVQNLYSWADRHIVEQFHRVYGEIEPLMIQAFALIDDQQAFVDFYRLHAFDDFVMSEEASSRLAPQPETSGELVVQVEELATPPFEPQSAQNRSLLMLEWLKRSTKCYYTPLFALLPFLYAPGKKFENRLRELLSNR